MRPSRSPLVLLVGSLVLAACGGFDAGNPYRVRPGEAPDTNATEPPPGEGEGEGSADGSNETPDGGDTNTIVPSDPDASTPPPKPTVFTGAPAYAATAGPTTRIAQHNFAGATPTTNPAGRPCMQCHGAAGPAPRFLIAGTIWDPIWDFVGLAGAGATLYAWFWLSGLRSKHSKRKHLHPLEID